jgi:Tfp pilus assembly protein PilF
MATNRKPSRNERTAVAVAPTPQPARWPYAAIAVAGLILALWVYSPSVHGPFLFDDNYALPKADDQPSAFLHGVRPLLMLTYWLNARSLATDTYSYHVINVLLHCAAGALMFFIVRRFLELSGFEAVRRNWLAGFAAAIFLLHPVQTEAVAYVAGRSETLSVTFFLAAYAVFLCRRSTVVSWGVTAAVFLLFGAALLSKEHTIVLPALLLLTDYWWNPGFSFAGIRRNWRIYAPMVVGAIGGIVFLLPLLLNGNSAGFGLKDLTWYQYFFTQCRALFVYPFLFVLPVGQSADWNFPMSKTILDHGAIIGLVALLALVAAAWHYRRTYRLASFGLFAHLLLMAPTSSILPIKDAVAERRLYLSMLGLLLIALEFLGRAKFQCRALAATCAAAVIVYAGVAHARAQVWSSELALWQDTVEKSPSYRAHFQLASAYYNANLCDRAVAEFQKASQLQTPQYDLLLDWGLAYDCVNQPESALAKLRQAAAQEPSAHVYTQIAKVYAGNRRWVEANDALSTAEKLDPNFAPTYWYRGKIHLAHNELEAAVQDLQHTLSLDPNLGDARQDLVRAQRLLLARH